jgi:hypothetical protein
MKIIVSTTGSFWFDPWMKDIVQKNNIQLELLDPEKQYHPDEIICIGLRCKWNHLDDSYPNNRIIVEGQGESNSGKWATVYEDDPRILFMYGSCSNSVSKNIVFYENFFWHQLALDYISRGYNKYRPNKTYKKKFLMPIRNWKGQASWRREVFEQLKDIISDSIYSMYEDGIYLPGSSGKSDVREIHYSWFDDTYFSLTLESYYDHAKPIFKTEKVFKPLAFYHPFQVIASPGFLKNLKDHGFETFDNLFDETYDSEIDINKKIQILKNNSFNFKYQPYDKLTLEKLEHNHNHFYNTELIYNGIQKGFIDPILEWCNK